MNNRLKQLMKELGDAINESLSDSDEIAGVIGKIKASGYDVFLVLEATIGFNKREESSEDDTADETELEERPAHREFESSAKIKWTSQDQKFLRALKIAIDDDSH